MEKKIVSVRLEKSEHEYFKKRARQEGITFTDYVSKSMFHFDDFLIKQKNDAEELEESKLALRARTENSNDFSSNYTNEKNEYLDEILQINQAIKDLGEEYLNEKSRHNRISKKISELSKHLKRIKQKMDMSDKTASNISNQT